MVMVYTNDDYPRFPQGGTGGGPRQDDDEDEGYETDRAPRRSLGFGGNADHPCMPRLAAWLEDALQDRASAPEAMPALRLLTFLRSPHLRIVATMIKITKTITVKKTVIRLQEKAGTPLLCVHGDGVPTDRDLKRSGQEWARIDAQTITLKIEEEIVVVKFSISSD